LYAAENKDELTLTEGETKNILDDYLEDSGMWQGELIVQDNYVEIIKEEVRVICL
jgi:hypothetical protein